MPTGRQSPPYLPLALLLTFVGGGVACGRRGEGPPEPASRPARGGEAQAPLRVELGGVEVRRVPRYLTLTGSVQADRQSEVAANVAGRVTGTFVERGQPVKQGEVIARVDSKAASFQAQAASAQSQAAEAQVAQAKQDCARADRLFGQGAMAKAEYERVKTACTAQLHGAEAARAQAELAGKLAGDTIIRSPINGVVGERYLNVGEYVMPASRVASVYAVDPVRVSISVPEPVVGQIREGQALSVRVAAYPERDFPAIVKFVSASLRPQTRDLIIEAIAENADGALRPGMFATVRLVTGEEELPTVPATAIQADGTVRRLFLARDGAAHELVVRTGVERDGRVAVLEPLDGRERVILRPPRGLKDGTAIQ